MRRWRQWTLRSRLALAMVLLTALALVAANTAGMLLLWAHQLGQIDRQLATAVTAVQRFPQLERQLPAGIPGSPAGIGAEVWLQLYAASGEPGRIMIPAWARSRPRLGDIAALRAHLDGQPYTVDSVADDGRWRVRIAPVGNAGGFAVIAMSLVSLEELFGRLLLIDLAVSGAVIVILGVVAARVVRLGMRPLTRMQRVAERIAAGDLATRVDDTDGHTEPGRLGMATNVMLDRIQREVTARGASEQRLRQFLADASHELPTPVTSIMGFAELYRRGGVGTGPALAEAMAHIENAATRMDLLVNDLLMLAALDQERPHRTDPVDLLSLAADTVREAHARAPDKPVELDTLTGDDTRFEPVTVSGDPPRLHQVVTNLVDNALRHTPQRTRITIRVGAGDRPDPSAVSAAVGEPPTGPVAILEVDDTGPGIPTPHAQRVFERFYRADPGRARVHGGAGLGLAIAAAIVQAHHGRIELITGPGGTRFRVLLPLGHI